jgi:hypothetical protein
VLTYPRKKFLRINAVQLLRLYSEKEESSRRSSVIMMMMLVSWWSTALNHSSCVARMRTPRLSLIASNVTLINKETNFKKLTSLTLPVIITLSKFVVMTLTNLLKIWTS